MSLDYILCPALDTNAFADTTQRSANTKVTYHCDSGATLQGERTLTCGINGIWSSAPPRCSSSVDTSLSQEEQIIIGVTVSFAIIVIIIIVLILICVFVMKKEEKGYKDNQRDYGGGAVMPFYNRPSLQTPKYERARTRPRSYVDTPYYYYGNDRFATSTQGYRPKKSYYEVYSLDRPRVHSRPAIDWQVQYLSQPYPAYAYYMQ